MHSEGKKLDFNWTNPIFFPFFITEGMIGNLHDVSADELEMLWNNWYEELTN